MTQPRAPPPVAYASNFIWYRPGGSASRFSRRNPVCSTRARVSGRSTFHVTDSVTWNVLRPDTRARVEQTGFRLLNRLALPPGRYQMKFDAYATGGGALGWVIYELEGPALVKSPPTMA